MALLSGAVLVVGASLLSLAMRSRLIIGTDGPGRRLAEGILFVAILVLVGQFLGLMGHLSPSGILIAGLLLILLAGLERRRALDWARTLLAAPGREARLEPNSPDVGRTAGVSMTGIKRYLTPALVTLVVVAIWAALISEGIDFGIFRQDSLWYHLTFAARFVQEGSIGQLVHTDPLGVMPWFFPQNIELIHALGMVWLGSDFLSLFINVLALVLTLLAAWCLGSTVRGGSVTLLVAAYVLITPSLLSQAATAAVDLPVTALILGGVVFLFRGWDDQSEAGEVSEESQTSLSKGGPFILSGLAFGLAAGSKLTALIPLGVVFLGIALLAPRGRRLLWTGSWGLAAALTSGFWYLRNLAVSGNPLPWLDLGLLEPVQSVDEFPRPAYSIGEYLEQPSIAVLALPPQFDSALGPLWPFLVILVLAGLTVGMVAGKPVISRVVALSLALLVIAHVVINPISASGVFPEPVGLAANLRYLAPAFVLGPIFLVRWLAERAPDVIPFLSAGLITSLIFTAISDPPSSGGYFLALLILVVPPSLALAIAMLRVPAVKGGILVVAAVAICLGLTVAVFREYGDEVGERPRQSEALGMPGFVDSTEWSLLESWAEEIPDARIGVSGPAAAYGQYTLVGRSLQHTVRYIGQSRGNGSWGPARSCEEWRQRVNAADADYLVLANEGFGPTSQDPSPTLWTRTDESALEIGRGDFLSIFAVDGQLDPATCEGLGAFKSESTLWGGESSLLRANLPALSFNVLRPGGAIINSGK